MKSKVICLFCICLLVGCGKSSHDNDALIDSLYHQGRHFVYLHQYDSALTYFTNAENLITSNTPLRIQGKIYANLASLYKDAGVYEQAMDYAQQSLRVYENVADTACILLSWMDMADIYTRMDVEDKYQRVQNCYDMALVYFNTYSNDTIKGRIYQEKGTKYVQQNLLDSGLHCLYQSLLMPAQGNAASIRMLYIGLAHQKKTQYDSAKIYIDRALHMPNGIRQRSGCYNILLDIAKAENDTASINRYATIVVAYKDSILHIENQAARQVVSLNNTSHEMMIKKHLHTYGLCGIGFLCIVIGFFFLVELIRRKRMRVEESELNQTMESLQEQLAEEQKRKDIDRKVLDEQLNTLKSSLLKTGIKSFDQWKVIKTESTHRYLYALMDKLYVSFPFLTERELQICLLILLQVTNEEIAHMLFLSPNSVSKTKQRLAQRVGTTAGKLREYLLQYIY